MARTDQLVALLASHVRGDDRAFRAAADRIVTDERRRGHRSVACELERALDEPIRRAEGPAMRSIPMGRDDRPLLQLVKPERGFDELVLADGTRTVLDEVAAENAHRSTLLGYQLRPRQRLLFMGRPGTGKSASAHALAAELSLPVAVASLAALTSSFLGETARNVEAVVRFADQVPCVLLFDEFDVLGQERSAGGDHGEMRRVAATVLQLLERVHGDSIVVATSNHPQLLDAAIWRRFDEVVTFGALNRSQLTELIALRLRAVRSTISAEGWATEVAGLAPAEVELVCFDAMRRAILTSDATVTDGAMSQAVASMHARRDSVRNLTSERVPE